MTLYLKYRPQKIDDLDLTYVRGTLQKLIKSGNIPHAFLFAGQKGTGKTSAARIIAKILNCEKKSKIAKTRKEKYKEPCNKCEQCKSISKGTNIDVVEIDAASHRGIDDVRALREAVKLSPVSARKKVYIIDEAHMLTTEASNALLKTLEEPPDHVVFILATTNPEKLIETIKSRTFLVQFNKASIEEITLSLNKKAKGEKIKFETEALVAIAKASEGSFRDATKLLEQLINENVPLKGKKVSAFISQKGMVNIDAFIEVLAKDSLENILNELERVLSSGLSTKEFIEMMLERLRLGLLAEIGLGGKEKLSIAKRENMLLLELLIKAQRDIPYAYIEQLPLEIALIKWYGAKKKEVDSNEIKGDKNDGKEDKFIEAKKEGSGKLLKNKKQKSVNNLSDEVWRKILTETKMINTSIEALLRAAKPIDYNGKVLRLGVYYKFHKERLEEEKYRRILEGVIEKILNSQIKVVCTLNEMPKNVYAKKSEEVILTQEDNADIVKVAKDIFKS